MRVKVSISIDPEVYEEILRLSKALNSSLSYAFNLAAKIGIERLREIVLELKGK